MADQVDDNFCARADAHIALANEQAQHIGKGKVSASFLYGAARFNAYISAINSGSLECMQSEKKNIVAFYTKEYKKMLIEHLDDYIENYESYMATPGAGEA
jgi:hypothetical protein